MPRVRYLGGGGYHIRDGPDFDTEGDEAEVGPNAADRLTDRHDFELVDGGADSDDRDTSERAAALAEEHWQTVCSEIRSGDVDDLLDDLAEMDDRKSVQAAIGERRAELE
jgi:hypothetical protein